MKFKKYTFCFRGGPITVRALNEEQAIILAQAEAINRGWDHTILTSPPEMIYHIYYKKNGELQDTYETFGNEFDASQRCHWLNENTLEGVFGKFVYKEESHK